MSNQEKLNQFEPELYQAYRDFLLMGHPAANDYQRMYNDYRAGKDIAPELSDEIQSLLNWGEWRLVERLLRALMADARGIQLSSGLKPDEEPALE